MDFMMLFLRMESLLVFRPLHPAGAVTGGCHTPLTGVTLTSGLTGGLSEPPELLTEVTEEAMVDVTTPPPGAASGDRMITDKKLVKDSCLELGG